MIEIKSYYAKTHQGPYLNINEDDVQVDLEYKIFNIFDGFGGSSIGDKAVDLVKEKIESFFSRVSNDPDATMPYFYSPRYLLETNALINAIHLAHNSLLEENSSKQMNERAGVSVLSAMMSESILSLVSIGNCCAYLMRNNQLSLISPPDCISPIEKTEHNINLKTFPLVALGLHDEIMPKVWEINIQEGDRIVFLSDGVFSRLGMDDLKFVLRDNERSEHQAILDLFKAANDKGNLDNQSAILVSV